MEALLAVHKHVTRKQGEEDKLDVVDSLTGIFDTHFDIHLVSYFLLLRCVCSCTCCNVHRGGGQRTISESYCSSTVCPGH